MERYDKIKELRKDKSIPSELSTRWVEQVGRQLPARDILDQVVMTLSASDLKLPHLAVMARGGATPKYVKWSQLDLEANALRLKY